MSIKKEILYKANYIDFKVFIANLSDSQLTTLKAKKILLLFPILGKNQFEYVEFPISLRILHSTLQSAGCNVQSTLINLNQKITISKEGFSPDFIVIHPMIAILDHLSSLLDECKRVYPEAKLILQNSDQHQHEKIIGGPGL